MLTTAESWNYRLKCHDLAFGEIYITGGIGVSYVMHLSVIVPVSPTKKSNVLQYEFSEPSLTRKPVV